MEAVLEEKAIFYSIANKENHMYRFALSQELKTTLW